MNRTQLPNRPIAFDDETPASILIRAAEENGHTSVYQLLSGTGIEINELSFKSCLIDPPRYKTLIEAIGLDTDATALPLERLSESKCSPRRYRCLNMPNNFFRPDASAFCSACLEEHPYWRKQWLVRPFSVCIKHKRLLVDHCLACGRILAVGRGKLMQCNHCQSSLLAMIGATINVDAMCEIEKMLASNQTDALHTLLEFWAALVRFDKLGENPATENSRLDISLSFLREEVSAVEEVATQIVQRLSTSSPRMQLLPFLSGSAKLVNFAESILSQTWPILKAGDGDPRLSFLSKKEVGTLLKMSPTKVNLLITSGYLRWPKDGSRQQKISATEIEMRLQGFSQIELWCMNVKDIHALIHGYDTTTRIPRPGKRRLHHSSIS